MSATSTTIAEQLDAFAADAMARCTTCGACYAACPTAKQMQLPQDDAPGAVSALMALTKGEAGDDIARRWVEACNGSGNCTAACPEDINVRQWVSVARLKNVEAKKPLEARAANASQRFRTMAQAVRLLSSMQIPSDALKRITAPAERRKAEVIFYTGCNVLRTPQIIFSIMDLLDVLAVDYDVVGGASHCCGVYQFLDSDLETYDKVGGRTYRRLGQSGASRVLTWCPSCQKQFAEVEEDRAPAGFDLDHVSNYLAENIDKLRSHFVDQPKRRAVLHSHEGIPGNLESIKALLRAIPNFELIDVAQDSAFTYTCNGSMASHAARELENHSALAEAAAREGVDTLVTMYHSCQRNLAGAEALYDFEVRNFTELLAEAVGRGGHPDNYKRFKSGRDLDQALLAARTYMLQNGVKVDAAQMEQLGVLMFSENGLAPDGAATKAALLTLAE